MNAQSNDQILSDQTPNDQTPNDQTPNDQTPNDPTPNDQTPNDQTGDEPPSVYDQAASALEYALQNPGECPPAPWTTSFGTRPHTLPTSWVVNTLEMQSARKARVLGGARTLGRARRFPDGTILKQFDADPWARMEASVGWHFPIEELEDGVYDMDCALLCVVDGRMWWLSTPPKGFRSD